MVLNVDGTEVVLTRKRIKRITMRVTADGVVAVSAPYGVKQDYLENFVRSKRDWINKILSEKSNGPFFCKTADENGKITVFGDTYVIKHVLDGKKGVKISGSDILLHLGEKTFEKRGKILADWLRLTLLKEINESLKKWNTLTGLDCSDVAIKDMKSRWGSCNVVTKKINFSVYLVTQPKQCVDYVVLHELTHTVYRNHDKNFYGYVARFMPDHRSVSKKLAMPVKN